jgi:hypothetical protein
VVIGGLVLVVVGAVVVDVLALIASRAPSRTGSLCRIVLASLAGSTCKGGRPRRLPSARAGRRPARTRSRRGSARAVPAGALPSAHDGAYWQTPTTPVPAGPLGVLHVPVITTFPTVPLQHGVPPPTQLRPLGRQQLHRVALPDLSVAQFVQQAPSVERQWPLFVLYCVFPHCLQNAVSDDPDWHPPDWQVSDMDPKSLSPVHASMSSQFPAAGTPMHPGANCVLLTATMAQ